MTVQGIFNNVFYGIILSIPVAALLCRNNSTGLINQNKGGNKL
jgi:tetrahydromethanopterin S-methyltransferase subunit B